jgi:hypothetical protein
LVAPRRGICASAAVGRLDDQGSRGGADREVPRVVSKIVLPIRTSLVGARLQRDLERDLDRRRKVRRDALLRLSISSNRYNSTAAGPEPMRRSVRT